MDAVRIYGGNCLSGQTKIQGSKNASLPILAATLLIDGTCEIVNCPDISDVYHMLRLLQSLGCLVSREADVVRIDTKRVEKVLKRWGQAVPEVLPGSHKARTMTMEGG